MGILRPRRKPKRIYPNSDRFEEDGRRIYSAYAPASRPRRRTLVKRLRLAAVVLVVVAAAFAIVVISLLPH